VKNATTHPIAIAPIDMTPTDTTPLRRRVEIMEHLSNRRTRVCGDRARIIRVRCRECCAGNALRQTMTISPPGRRP